MTRILALLIACITLDSTARAQEPALMARADSLSSAAMDHLDWGRFEEAEDVLRQALELDIELFGPDDIMVAHTAYDLACVLWFEGQEEEAKSLFGRAEALYRASLDLPMPTQRSTAWARPEYGPPLPKRVRMPRSASLEKSQLNRARAANNLGFLYGRTGANTEAWDLLSEAIHLEEKWGNDPVEIAISRHNQLLFGWIDLTHEPTWAERATLALPLFVANRTTQSIPLEVAHRRMLTVLSDAGEARRTFDELESLIVEQYGKGHWQTGNIKHERAAELWRAFGPTDEVVRAQEQSTEILTKALGFRHREVQHGLASLVFYLTGAGRLWEADSVYQLAMPIAAEIYSPENRENTRLLAFGGALLQLQGRYREATGKFLRAAELFGRTGDLQSQAQYLGLAAASMIMQGELAEAEGAARKAIGALETAKEVMVNASLRFAESNPHVYLPLANVYARQGRLDEAFAIVDRVRNASATFYGPDALGVEQSLAELSGIYLQQGALEEAEPVARSVLEMRQSRHENAHPDLGNSYTQLGDIDRARKAFVAAEASYAEAVRIMEASVGPDHPLVAGALVDLVGNRWEAGTAADPEIEILDRAIDILAASGSQPASRIEALALRARLTKASGDSRGALDDMEEALEILDDLRPQVGGGEETRAGFLERYAGFYDTMIGWLVEAGDVEEAWGYSERGRARVMLDQLSAGRIPLRQGIPPDQLQGLEEREDRSKIRMAELELQISRLRSDQTLSDPDRLTRLAQLETDLVVASRDFQSVYDEIKNASPLWRDQLTSGGRPVGLGSLQRNAIPAGGLLLSYQLGTEQSLLFVVGNERGQVEAMPLVVSPADGKVLGLEPGAATLSSIRRAMSSEEGGGVLDELTTRSRVAGARSGPESTARLHALWHILVPEPLRDRLLAASEVIVAPDDALNSLPFEALVVELGEEDVRYWLDVAPPIRYTASATVLYNIEGRPAPSFGMLESALLTVADPVYDLSEIDGGQLTAAPAGDAAASQTEEALRGVSSSLTRDSFTRAGGTLVRLPGTRRESDEIIAVAASSEVVALRGLEATESNVRGQLEGKRYVHVAAHGLVGGPRGALFASLALTPQVEAQATSEDDGYLQLHEIYELPLDATELAVLSACETNVGKAIEGEGVFALSRGFLAAGARRVVASQWAVDDASTAALMGQFFEAIASADRKGASPDYATSLAEAKQAIRADERWSDPYYWAPFVLAGKR